MSTVGLIHESAGTHSDAGDVELSLAGDQEACRRIYERYSGMVFALIFRCGLNWLKDDLLQTTFKQVFEHLHDLDDPATLKSWIGTIARNVCLTAVRRERGDTVSLDELTEEGDPLQLLQIRFEKDAPLNAVIRNEDIRSVRTAIAELQEPFRTLVDLFYMQEMQDREIAEHMDRPIGSVKSGLFRARKLLRQALEHTQVHSVGVV
jgi:RNA polymerase sigma-70 factor, ECF subfamily